MDQRDCRQRVYDHRLRELVRRTGNVGIATELGIPRSTVAGWLCSAPQPVISHDVLGMTEVALQAEVIKLRRRIQTLNGVLGLLLAVLRVSGFRLDRAYISDPPARTDLLRAAERARKHLSVSAVLGVLRISASRYNLWIRAERGCGIEDRTMCPRSLPNQLTPEEVLAIGQMVTAERYRHVPTGRLAVLAQRLGNVFASPSTWYRLVRDQGWRRPRWRLHPDSPRVGVRASKPDEIWHIDTSSVRLVDGTKVWLHAVIDNFSRKILAWRVAERFEIASAIAVLQAAVRNAVSGDRRPQLMADGGVENFNGAVDEFVGSGLLSRVRADARRGLLRSRRGDPCGIRGGEAGGAGEAASGQPSAIVFGVLAARHGGLNWRHRGDPSGAWVLLQLPPRGRIGPVRGLQRQVFGGSRQR